MSLLHREMPSLCSIKARQAFGAVTIIDCSVITMVFDAEGHVLEEKTLLFFLCFAVPPMAAFPILGMVHA